ncbi:MAG: ATP-binding protein [Deltaproteobacteria bacterium]|nr:ATP-binding protein [Deltaproteobacteria bacterium]
MLFPENVIFKDCVGLKLKGKILRFLVGWLLIIVFIFSYSTILVAEVLVLGDEAQKIRAGKYLELYLDETGVKNIKDIEQLEAESALVASESVVPNYGFTRASLWAKLRVKNSGDIKKTVYLEVDYPHLDHLNLFHPFGDEGQYRIERYGDSLPFNQRKLHHRNFVTHFEIEAFEERVIYFQLSTQDTLQFPLIVYANEYFINQEHNDQFVFGFYYGLMIVLVVYSLILFYMIRDKSYLIYFFYLIGYVLFQLILNGYAYELLWSDYPWWAKRSRVFFIGFGFFFALFFAKIILNTHKKLPKLDKVIQVFMVGNVFIMPLSLIVDFYIMIQVAVFYAAPCVFIIMWAGIRSAMKKYRPAILYLSAWLMIALGILVSVLRAFGILPRTLLTEYGMQIGSVFEVVLFFFGLADRMNFLRRERLQVQENLLKTQGELLSHLKQTDRMKDEFLANTTHELKTPLHGIIGLSESILSKSKSNLNSKEKENISLISNSGRRLLTLVESLLDLSSIKFGNVRLDLKPVDLKKTVDIVLTFSQTLVMNKKLTLINDVPEKLPKIEADENRLEQILYNLISNAIKHTEEGEIVVSAVTQNRDLKITVSDTGIGINFNKEDSIFDPFVLGKDEKSQFHGVGLGLSICRSLVELHRGKIAFESTVGKGTEFFFTIPLYTKLEDPKESAIIDTRNQLQTDLPEIQMERGSLETQNQEGYRIFAVDDDPINHHVLENYLEGENMILSKFLDPEEALSFVFEEQKPDLILLDIMMPKLSGFEFIKALRKKYSESELPVIFLTAKDQIQSLVEGFSLGGSDYVTKPFNRNEIINRIQKCLFARQTRDHLHSLRAFAEKFTDFDDIPALFKNIVDLHCRHNYLSQAAYYQNGELIHHNGTQNKDSPFLPETPSEQILAFFNQMEDEITLIKLEGTKNKIDPVKAGILRPSVKQGCLMVLNIEEIKGHHIAIHSTQENTVLREVGEEYFRNLVRMINSLPRLSSETASDEIPEKKDLENIFRIMKHQKDIAFIKSESPYCKVVLDTPFDDSFLLRTTIQKIESYFNGKTFVRVHRSYLINPQKIELIKKSKQRDLCVQVKVPQEKAEIIPIGRSYRDRVKELV